jgi:hypothetical protein
MLLENEGRKLWLLPAIRREVGTLSLLAKLPEFQPLAPYGTPKISHDSHLFVNIFYCFFDFK